MPSGKDGHDGRVDDAQGFDSHDSELRIDHAGFRIRPHLAGSHERVAAVRAVSDVSVDFLVSLHGRTGEELDRVEFLELLTGAELAAQPGDVARAERGGARQGQR